MLLRFQVEFLHCAVDVGSYAKFDSGFVPEG